MMSLKKVLASAAVLAASAGSIVAVAPAAQATDYPGVWNCPASHVCIWEHSDFRGVKDTISGYHSYANVSAYMHDRGSSWMNANYYRNEWLGEWSHGRKLLGSYLPPQYRGTNLVHDNFNDRVDFVMWG
ncbi:peptidase inhibitor family I36 protein [uncultured Rothia sp.]|jgi:hypothetical protein|uniref:peptidase inhibitor family I36 protein n=1 Tax=uncultured Rothia sp. TaxID=316088 RepID=UPI002540CBB7|nr:peptidase inhibitor family I36 protein [uncultured Rothia sp.]